MKIILKVTAYLNMVFNLYVMHRSIPNHNSCVSLTLVEHRYLEDDDDAHADQPRDHQPADICLYPPD